MSAADVLEEKMWIIIRCERSVTIIILIRLDYLVHIFGNYTITLPTNIGNCKLSFHFIGGVVRLPLPSRWRRWELAYVGFRVAELRLARVLPRRSNQHRKSHGRVAVVKRGRRV